MIIYTPTIYLETDDLSSVVLGTEPVLVFKNGATIRISLFDAEFIIARMLDLGHELNQKLTDSQFYSWWNKTKWVGGVIPTGRALALAAWQAAKQSQDEKPNDNG